MASASKRKGSVKTEEWCKHLRPEGKRRQNRIVRADGKKQCGYVDPEFNGDDFLTSGELMTVTEDEVINLGVCFCWPYNDPENCDCDFESKLTEEAKEDEL
jgi:hypothetical protein